MRVPSEGNPAIRVVGLICVSEYLSIKVRVTLSALTLCLILTGFVRVLEILESA